MVHERVSVPFEEFVANANALFERIESQGTDVVVEHDGKLFSIKPKGRKPSQGKRLAMTADDSLFTIIGVAHSTQPEDIATHKHAYLAEAAGNARDQDA